MHIYSCRISITNTLPSLFVMLQGEGEWEKVDYAFSFLWGTLKAGFLGFLVLLSRAWGLWRHTPSSWSKFSLAFLLTTSFPLSPSHSLSLSLSLIIHLLPSIPTRLPPHPCKEKLITFDSETTGFTLQFLEFVWRMHWLWKTWTVISPIGFWRAIVKLTDSGSSFRRLGSAWLLCGWSWSSPNEAWSLQPSG